jgi:vacuolar-type H+-ATPase subunit I/STV1
MADELTSVENTTGTPNDGQTQSSVGAAPQERAPENKTTEKVDLFKLPEFRGYQAQMNRTVSQLQNELAQLKQAQAAAKMEGMDELERATYLLQEKENELNQYRAALHQREIQAQRDADLSELSDLTGAPKNVLAVAETYDEAVKLSIQWMKENGATAKEIREAKAEANRVDLGGGKAVTPVDREAQERADLLKRGDTKNYFLRILEG